jgi:hypothetical protein|nr:MAG TPA: hypothetical protein [Caudoviricetes sp.]
MIKSDFGTVEVNGREPVIMVEFESLLGVLRKVLGDKKYNLVLQNASNKKLSKDGKEISRKGEKERLVEALKTFFSEMEDK